MTPKRFAPHGQHISLPISGDTLVEIRLSICQLLALVFQADDNTESEITIEDCLTLRRGSEERRLAGTKPGAAWNPQELSPLLELLGAEVSDAVAEREGLLRISFANQLVLEVVSTTGFEAWHFHYPRPGRPPAGNVREPLALHGAHGRLI